MPCAALPTGFACTDMSRPKIAIIAAMPGEICPLVKTWNRLPMPRRAAFPPACRVFVSDQAVAVVGGMGSEPIEAATEAAIRTFVPNLIISAGWAGALEPRIPVGTTVIPGHVVEAATGRSFPTFAGTGTLVSTSAVVDPQQKSRLAETYSAQAVDMEAATVAWLAQEAGVKFLAVKAVFDEFDRTAPGDRFRTPAGRFSYARFLAYTAIRPATWASLPRMARDARISARAVANVLMRIIACDSLTEIQQQILELLRLPSWPATERPDEK